MELRNIAEALGIPEYPEVLDQATPVDICDIGRIAALQEEFNLFGDFYEAVCAAAKTLAQDPQRLAWGEAIAGYAAQATISQIRTIPFPLPEGKVDMLPLLVHLPMIPGAIASYRSRGFSEETIRELMASYRGCMSVVLQQTGISGLDKRYYGWLFLYSKALIFRYKGFLFEVASVPDRAVFLKNKETGQLVPLLLQGSIHRSGLILGSAGCEDPEGSREVTFRETAEGFYGYPATKGKVTSPETFFPASQWSCALRPGQFVLSAHLPRGMDISPANVDEAFQTVARISRQWYPDYDIQGISCGSWLLDPQLEDILGSNSKITAYAARFSRYPLLSAGREVFNFVFPHGITDLNQLPENTRLERGLKKLYLSGGYIHAYCGVIL